MPTPARKSLDELSFGFRSRLLSFDELTRQVRAWADAYPDLCRVTSIGKTPEGRDLWLLTLGPDPDRARPSAWIDDGFPKDASTAIRSASFASSRRGDVAL